MFWVYLFLSFFVVSFGQPAWVPYLGIGAGAIGYALFWRALLLILETRKRILWAWGWFSAVQAIQLSWLMTTDYMGWMILPVYLFLSLGLGGQFALISSLIRPGAISSSVCFALAGGWTLLEWIRLYFLSGFTWNPVGMALADSSQSIQLAALLGVYGLSFWVILTNGLALKAFVQKKGHAWVAWACVALFPYGFGFLHQNWVAFHFADPPVLSVALLQTALKPEQKDYFPDKAQAYIGVLDQWDRALGLFQKDKPVDLIVFPEVAFSLPAYQFIYPLDVVEALWESHFGSAAKVDFPPLQRPYARTIEENGKEKWVVNHAFLAQALANHYRAALIIGLDDVDKVNQRHSNAAFFFQEGQSAAQKYEKRVLVPVSEYIPLQGWNWIRCFLSEHYGIFDSLHVGQEAKIFEASIPLGVSICVEEVYSHLLRELRQKGAHLFVNLSNDIWFPHSKLARQHFDHARLRAVENGVCLIRSCNTGVTGGVDCFGKPLDLFPAIETLAGVHYLQVPIHSYATLYTEWGNGMILAVSCLSLLFFALIYRRKSCPK